MTVSTDLELEKASEFAYKEARDSFNELMEAIRYLDSKADRIIQVNSIVFGALVTVSLVSPEDFAGNLIDLSELASIAIFVSIVILLFSLITAFITHLSRDYYALVPRPDDLLSDMEQVTSKEDMQQHYLTEIKANFEWNRHQHLEASKFYRWASWSQVCGFSLLGISLLISFYQLGIFVVY